MLTVLFGPFVAAAVMVQFQGATLNGNVVDEAGKPVAGAHVIMYYPAAWASKEGPVDIRTTTDAEGRFRLSTPKRARIANPPATVWAYRGGTAMTAVYANSLMRALVVRQRTPRPIVIEGPDGRPISGARIAPRVVLSGGRTYAQIPDILAAPRAVTTGPDGKAMLDCLAADDILVAVRITAEPIGTQDFQLLDRPRRQAQASTIALRLKPTSRLEGRIRNRAGEPVVNQAVEVWFMGGSQLPGNPVEFKNGPLWTAADGSFRTPDNLQIGSTYRVVVRAPGTETILSDWITIEDKPRILLPMLQRPLRTLIGRVVDRQGRPVADIEVFQAGDGPERTTTRTDGIGRFELGGFRQGPVFLFARGEGFRFWGRLVKSDEDDIAIELTRTSERPARQMKMLDDAIPLEESRALARRLIEPRWNDAVEKNNPAVAVRALRSLASADPVGALRKLKEVNIISPASRSAIEGRVVEALAQTDPGQAEAVASAIDDPGLRAASLLVVVDALPMVERARRVELLDRVARETRGIKDRQSRMTQMGDVAERWCELRDREKAKALFEEVLPIASEPGDAAVALRSKFAARLALVDLPLALAIIKSIPAGELPYERLALQNIAFRLAAEKPADAERVLRLIPKEPAREWLPPVIARKMAAADPTRAQRLVEEANRHLDNPVRSLFLALGLKSSDPAAAYRAFQTAMRSVDQLTDEETEYSTGTRGILLPLVEQIDPALVPELFWRAVALRPSAGNPRLFHEDTGQSIERLAWYDREVAAVMFEPIRAQMEHVDDRRLALWTNEFLGWSIFDPRAVARLEQVSNSNFTSFAVAESLGRSHEERWRQVWSELRETAGFVTFSLDIK